MGRSAGVAEGTKSARTGLKAIAVLCSLATVIGAAPLSRHHHHRHRHHHSTSPIRWPSGAFAGSGKALKEFGKWRGQPIGVAHRFAASHAWSDIELSTLSTKFGYRKRLVISIAMLPTTDPTASIELGASGAYNDRWRVAAQRLVAGGMGNAIIRPGWEFNQKWPAWAARSDPEAYAGYFQQIVKAMRSVPGQAFRFNWCLSASYYGWDPRTAYPGDAYVDMVGLDQYDGWYNHPSATPQERWNFILHSVGGGAEGGLTFWARFARQHRKPLALSEWGLTNKYAHMAGPRGGGGGDDPFYIRRMHRWLASHNIAYEAYLDSNAPDGHHKLRGGEFPKATAVYRALW